MSTPAANAITLFFTLCWAVFSAYTMKIPVSLVSAILGGFSFGLLAGFLEQLNPENLPKFLRK